MKDIDFRGVVTGREKNNSYVSKGRQREPYVSHLVREEGPQIWYSDVRPYQKLQSMYNKYGTSPVGGPTAILSREGKRRRGMGRLLIPDP